MGGGGEREVLHRPSLGLSLRASCIHSRLELGFYLGNSLPISRRLGRLEVGAPGARAPPPRREVEQLGLDVTGHLLQCGDIPVALAFVQLLALIQGSTGFLCEPPAFTGPLVLQGQVQ